MKEIIVACILFALSILAIILSVRSFKEKGFLFNNAYIYATKQEREKMNKKTHYRQSAIVFLLIALIFLLNAVSVLFKVNWIFYIVIALVIAACLFAIVSSVKIGRNNKQ